MKLIGRPQLRVQALRLLSLLSGCFLIALSFNLFLNPNHIASGGVPGLSTIGSFVTSWQPAYLQWSLNLLLLTAGWIVLGRRFAARTVLGAFLLPLFVHATSDLATPTANPLLASIYGGIGTGIGLALVFSSRSSVGGVTVIAHMLHRFLGMHLSSAVALIDFAVIAAAGFVFTAEASLYALIGVYVMKKTITVVQEGFSQSKVAYIISDRLLPMKEAILGRLDRGLTEIPGIGGYTGHERPVLMVVLEQEEVPVLKSIVLDIDPDAFMILTDAREVNGEGFNRFRQERPTPTLASRYRQWLQS